MNYTPPGHHLSERRESSLFWFGWCFCGQFIVGVTKHQLALRWRDHIRTLVAAGGRFAPLYPE